MNVDTTPDESASAAVVTASTAYRIGRLMPIPLGVGDDDVDGDGDGAVVGVAMACMRFDASTSRLDTAGAGVWGTAAAFESGLDAMITSARCAARPGLPHQVRRAVSHRSTRPGTVVACETEGHAPPRAGSRPDPLALARSRKKRITQVRVHATASRELGAAARFPLQALLPWPV